MARTTPATPTEERCVTSYPARRGYAPGVFFPPEAPNVTDAIDIHCHAHGGQQDALALAKFASVSGMRGLLFKTITDFARPADAVARTRDALDDWAEAEEDVRPIECWAGALMGFDGSAPTRRWCEEQIESGAIAQYLCEKYDDGRLGRGPGHPERYEWLQWIHYAETVAVHGASLVQQSVFIPEEQRSPIVQKLESRRLEKAVEVLDHHLKDRDYLLASGFSAADVNVGYSIHLGDQFLSFDAFPTAMQYYDRLRERPAFQASVPKKEG